MAEVTVYSKEHIDGILDQAITGAAFVGGSLIVTLGDGSTVNVGYLLDNIAGGTTDYAGAVELATDVETLAGTDNVRAVTPFTLAALLATDTRRGLVELSTPAENTTGTDASRAVTPAGMKAFAQPLDADLTAIAGLTATTDNIMQSKAGVWASRTPTQVATDLNATNQILDSRVYNGTAYLGASAAGAHVYVGAVDPASQGTIVNGSIWYDTTGS